MSKKYVIRQQVERRLASGVPRPYWVCKLMSDGQPAKYKIARNDSWEELQRVKDWAESQMTWDEIMECEATRMYLDCEIAALRPVEPLPEAKRPCPPPKLHEVFQRLVEAGELDAAVKVLRLAVRAGISVGFVSDGEDFVDKL